MKYLESTTKIELKYIFFYLVDWRKTFAIKGRRKNG